METANTFIHSRSSLENPPQFQTKTLMSRNACNGETGEKSPAASDLNWMPKVAPWSLAILAKMAVSHISLSFFFIWNRNDRYVRTLPLFPRKPYSIPDKPMTLTGGLSHICFIGADVFAGKKVSLLAKPLKPPAFLYICQPSLHDCDMELPNFNRPL